jgi:Zn finger protein HypA/HybF involved in hydrogenase expression
MNAILSMINELETVNKELANQADELKREVGRLSEVNFKRGCAIEFYEKENKNLEAMLPKVVVPKNLYDSDCYRCECNAVVGINYFSESHNWKQKYCGTCGSRMDWDKVEAAE